MSIRVRQDEDAELAAPVERLRELGFEESDEPGLCGGYGVAVLYRSAERPFLAGDLRAFSISDILGAANTGRREGTLVLEVPGGRKVVRFYEGEVTFASSTFEEDRLGEVLWRAGILTRESLDEASWEVGPGRRLGDVLVEGGYCSSADLYRGLVRQVRDIVLSLFRHHEGRFVFVEGQGSEINQVQLEGTTRELILTGIRQLDDLERFREAVPASAVYEAEPVPTGSTLTLHEEEILGLADGVRNAREIIEESGLGEYEGLKHIAHLVEARLLVARTAAAASAARLDAGSEVSLDEAAFAPEDEDEAGGPPAAEGGAPTIAPAEDEAAPEVEADAKAAPEAETKPEAEAMPFLAYTKAVARIHGILKKARKNPESLNSYFAQAPASYQSLFEGVRLDAEGRIDMPRLLANARSLHGDQYKGRALEALDAYQSFALFQARNSLPPEISTKLQRLVMLIQLGKA